MSGSRLSRCRRRRLVASDGRQIPPRRKVIQEALTNVIKHADTDRCQVTVTYQPHALALQVTDHGAGARDGSQRPAAGQGIARQHGAGVWS